MGGGKSLVKLVLGYCGMVAIHTHANAAEWNTVINGEGTLSYFPVKKDDTFVFGPRLGARTRLEFSWGHPSLLLFLPSLSLLLGYLMASVKL